MQVICVGEFHTTLVAGVPPNVTVGVATKSAPVMTTPGVSEMTKPLLGVTLDTVGALLYVKAVGKDPACVSGFVTVTVTAPGPAMCAGAVQVICVLEFHTTAVAGFPPKDTVAPLMKSVPVITTPAVVANVKPTFGLTFVTTGAATYVNAVGKELACASGFVTLIVTAPAA